jgi:hypothetical protein
VSGSMRRGNWSVQELERLRLLLPRRGVQDTAILLRRSPESVRKKAASLLANPPRKAAWTHDDDLRLRTSWGVLEPRLLGLLLGRSAADVLRRVGQLRERLHTGPWSRAELAMMKRLYGTRADDDLEVALLRPRTEVVAMAAQLCLAKDKRFRKAAQTRAAAKAMPRWTAAQVERLRTLYPDLDNLEVARQLGRTVTSVANKAHQMGLHKSRDLLARIGRDNVAVRYGDTAGAALAAES